jgi:hypothetical protein
MHWRRAFAHTLRQAQGDTISGKHITGHIVLQKWSAGVTFKNVK